MCWEPIVWASAEQTPFFNRVYGNAGRDFLVINETKGDPFKGPHPCPKLLPVMRWLVGLFLPAGGSVLDPFAGSGTTLSQRSTPAARRSASNSTPPISL